MLKRARARHAFGHRQGDLCGSGRDAQETRDKRPQPNLHRAALNDAIEQWGNGKPLGAGSALEYWKPREGRGIGVEIDPFLRERRCLSGLFLDGWRGMKGVDTIAQVRHPVPRARAVDQDLPELRLAQHGAEDPEERQQDGVRLRAGDAATNRRSGPWKGSTGCCR